MPLESSPENKTPEVDKMLARFEERVNRGVVERAEMERTFALTDRAFKRAKEILTTNNFFQTANAADYQMLSNAWLAWGENGIFKDPADAALRQELQTIFQSSDKAQTNLARRYARQIWRTQVSVYIIQEVGKLTKSDSEKSKIFEQIFASQIVTETEQAPLSALTGAMHLDDKIKDKTKRQNLAKEMAASTVHTVVPMAAVTQLAGREAKVKSVRVVVGGDLLTIDPKYTEAFLLQRVIYKPEEGRIYAQMENGCKGNLVIIDLVVPSPQVPEDPYRGGLGEGERGPVPPPKVVEDPYRGGSGERVLGPVPPPRTGSGAIEDGPVPPPRVVEDPYRGGSGGREYGPVPGEGTGALESGPIPPEVKIEPNETVLNATAQTERGREALRARFLGPNHQVILTGENAAYLKPLKIHHLYQTEPLYVNGRQVDFKEGAAGQTYYYPDGKRVQIINGTQILTEAQNQIHSSEGFRPADEYRLGLYASEFERNFGGELPDNPNELNRTWEGRLRDQQVLLSGLMNPASGLAEERGDLQTLQATLKLNQPGQQVVFFDIGPGIANQDLKIERGAGKPAITSQEMAQTFPGMPVVILDLPSEVDHFTGTKLHEGYPPISGQNRAELLAHDNIYVMRGDGLASLSDQWRDARTNPYPEKTRSLNIQDPSVTVVVRAANSIDIYCDWETQVKPALMRMAQDFKDQPVLLLFNQEILVKEAGSINWTLVGQVSEKGFDHVFRDQDQSSLGGKPFVIYG